MKTKAFLIALFILNMLQVSAQSCDEVTLVYMLLLVITTNCG